MADRANLFGSNISKVEAEAQNLANAGATVHVRTVDTMPGYKTDPGGYLKNVALTECPSWQANNLISIVVSKNDRQTGTFVGDLFFKNSLPESTQKKIRESNINSYFPADFAGGVANGLKVFNTTITKQLNPGLAPTTPPIVTGPVTNNNAATDYTGLWVVLGAVFVFIALVVVMFFVIRTLKTRASEHAARQTAQQKAKAAKTAAVKAVHDLGDRLDAPAVAVIRSVASMVSEADARELNEKFAAAETAVGQVQEHFSAVNNTDNDPDQSDVSVGVYSQIEIVFKEVFDSATEAAQTVRELETERDRLRELITTVPKKAEGLRERLTSTSAQVAAVGSDGFRITDFTNRLTDLSAQLDGVNGLLAQKGFSEADETLDQIAKQTDSVLGEALALPERKQKIAAALVASRAGLTQAQGQRETTRPIFESIESSYAHSSWESVAGNGTESQKRLTVANTRLETAQTQFNDQDWDGAEASLRSADDLITQAAALLTAITDLRDHLEIAKNTASSEIAAAQADIDRARAFIADHDPDVKDSLEADLEESQEMLHQASAELGRPKPDYLAVVKMAQTANSHADTILLEARNEFETAERIRRQSQIDLQSAEAAYSKAASYVSNHQGDLSSAPHDALNVANNRLQKARSGGSPQQISRRAKDAEEAADDAYKAARREFRAAENERDRRRREREEAERRRNDDFTTGVLVGTSIGRSDHHHESHDDDNDSGWGSFGGGGGGGGFGGFGGGGGGSSFGGFGGGGGGSSW